MRHAGFHGRAGFGARPALIVVDVNVGFTDPASPLVCDLEDVVAAIARLLDEARRAGIPVVYTTVSYDEADQAHGGRVHRQGPCAAHARGGQPLGRDRPADRAAAGRAGPDQAVRVGVLRHAALAVLLASRAATALIVTGASTSGCVRATAVDALQHGYRPIVPREAVGDRNPAAHEANLYDIDAKYGDVVSIDEVVAHLEELAGAHAR